MLRLIVTSVHKSLYKIRDIVIDLLFIKGLRQFPSATKYGLSFQNDFVCCLHLAQTRMPFSQRRTICITHRSQKHLQMDRKLISFHLTLILCNLDLDIQMTLTFLVNLNGIQAYRSNKEIKYVNYFI